VIDACEDALVKRQLCFMVARHGSLNISTEVDFVDFDLIDRIVGVSPCHPQARTGVALLTQTYEQDDELLAILGNAHLSENFLSLARDLDVFEAKTPEEIYKSHLTESRSTLKPGP